MSEEGPNKPRNASPDEAARARRQRNLAMALMIVGFVVLIYVVTIVRLGGAVGDRSF